MTRLEWSQSGSVIIENGVDRGVLYPRGGPGVPWEGLVNIEDQVAGGTHTPYYYDGVKYFDFIASEDFQAQVESYFAPPEFAPCEGTSRLSPGLYVTQQPRERFGFAYRTLILDEYEQTLGYKLHLVYNATAAPTPRSYSTLTKTPDAPTRSWVFHTVPPLATTYKPTAHIIIDSRDVHPNRLAAIEDILYGTASTDSRLPTQTELIDIFEDPGPIRRTNYIIDPRMTATPAWGSAPQYTKTLVSTGVQIDCPAGAAGSFSAIWNIDLPIAAEGEKWAGLFQFEVPVGFPSVNYTVRLTAIGPNNSLSPRAGTISAGETRTVATETSVPAPAGTTGMRLILVVTNPAAGMRLIVKRAMLEKDVDAAGVWFSGGSIDTEDVTYEWAGAADESYSYAKSWDVL